MKIIIIGGKGTVGSAVVKELSPRHEILIAGRSSSDLPCDITSEDSIRAMYKKAGKIDAVVIASGSYAFHDFSEMTSDKYYVGLNDKLMGQVNTVLIGREYISDGGSFTLTSGIIGHDPIRGGTSATMVNRAIEGFVVASAIEMPRNLRINVVCASVLKEAMEKYAKYFRGFNPVPAATVALAYSKSVEGLQTGQVYKVFG